MSDGYPVGCVRDGNNVSKIKENPKALEVERGHREYHDSNTGRGCETPDYARDDD